MMLGWKLPKGFSERSKESIRASILKEHQKKAKPIQLLPWAFLSGAAVSLALFLWFNGVEAPKAQDHHSVVEDVFVTSLLMETLLLDGRELDLRIQESLLDDFEKDLALN